MSKKPTLYLHEYLKGLTLKQKKELARKLHKQGHAYITQCIHGYNRPDPYGLTVATILEYQDQNPSYMGRMTVDSIEEGYEIAKDMIDYKKRTKEQRIYS